MALVFIKPHALTDQVKGVVEEQFEKFGIRVISDGTLASEVIDSQRLIDQHYHSIASKATILKPADMGVPNDKFKDFFKVDWAVASKQAFNALDACEALGIDSAEMDRLWMQAKQHNQIAKLGGGFYCAKISHKAKELFVFNGFFMQMRAKYTQPNTAIHYYVVDWVPPKLSWADFRANVIGATDPATAPAESLRGKMFANWKALGLSTPPDVGDNGVHASASPFEGLAERINWLNRDLKADPLGRALLRAGFDDAKLQEWMHDPQVELPAGGQKSLFDALEDKNAQECLVACLEIAGLRQPRSRVENETDE